MTDQRGSVGLPVVAPKRSARPWALVTGASSGIGEALARQLAQLGYDIVLVARDEARLAACARELTQASGANTLIASTDLGNPDALVALADQINAAGISIEVLVNNAGFGLHGAYEHSSVDQATDLLQVQLVALLKLTHELLPPMKRARRGYILNVASVYSLCPVPYQAVYSATKAFILSFSRALQTELEGSGVVVTVLCPGVTLTRFRSRQGYPESSSVKGMSAAVVAHAGLTGMFARRALVVPGLSNRIFVLLAQLLPAKAAMRMIGKVNHRRGLSAAAGVAS